ncbi:MAG TPA: YgiT-type zinc finger protein, partial [Thermodesulfobacteriota bacterium]|nr:YgiT-type zinc finger protein [Thermodesulfobacteriota bacterium]
MGGFQDQKIRTKEVISMKETMIETKVTYILEQGGKVHIIEHVPARICRE